MIYEMTVSQFLPFSEPGAGSSIEGQTVRQTLSIQETIIISKKRAILTQRINLLQNIKVRTSKRNMQVSQRLGMSGRASHGPSRTVTQIFPMWQKARSVKYQIVNQTINLKQTTSSYKFKGVYQSLVLNQVITTQIKRHLTLAQTFHMLTSRSAYLSSQDDCYVAHPYALGGPNGSPSYVF